MSARYRLIELLADGDFHSGQSLGRRLGISRAAVWKHIQGLAELGLDVHAVRGQGYRLAEAFTPLDQSVVRLRLGQDILARLDSLDVFQEIDSTSDYLKRSSLDGRSGAIRVCIAEWQRGGRGRRGRRWVSPYGANLYLSLAAQLTERTLASGGLSLAVAVAVAEALRACGVEGTGLKWPNDIFFQGRKLAGILLDLKGESGGPYRMIVGVGVNYRMSASAADAIDQPWTDLSQAGVDVDRNELAGMIIQNIVRTLDLFNERGLAAFLPEWERLDLVSGRTVELHQECEPMIKGVARGIDDRGALLIEHNGETRSYSAGEVSIRLPR
jgi:BirA family biotin operon repressor/biotin-[acetyl-CoA-carboxylase] ligase